MLPDVLVELNYLELAQTKSVKLQSLKEDGEVPEADILFFILRVIVPGSATILDSGGNDIQHQGPPAQANGGDQEGVQYEEVLDQGHLRPIGQARVSVADG